MARDAADLSADTDVESASLLNNANSNSNYASLNSNANANANLDQNPNAFQRMNSKCPEGKLLMQPLLPSGKSPQDSKERIASLDVFRGLTILGMIVVDFFGGFWAPLDHSPWNGVTFADFVVPSFLLIAGISIALTHKKVQSKSVSTQKVILRASKLFILGLFLQGGYFHGISDLGYGVNLQNMRIMGVLQRIALAYGIAALCEIFMKNKDALYLSNEYLGFLRSFVSQWCIVLLLIVAYLGLLYGYHVPDWKFEVPISSKGTNSTLTMVSVNVSCNVRGHLTPACNAVGLLDRTIMGISHLHRHPSFRRMKECSINSPYNGPLPDDAPSWCLAPFDPEGLLSTIMAIVTCFIGVHCGHVLVHVKGHRKRLQHWIKFSLLLILAGTSLSFIGMPLNKNIYTLSYTCLTAGVATLAFCTFYVLVDIYKWEKATLIFRWMGMHPLLIYVLVGCGVFPAILKGLYWGSPTNNLVTLVLKFLGL